MGNKESTVDMTFKEMFTGLYNIEFLHPSELESICKTAEAYAGAKIDNKLSEIREKLPSEDEITKQAFKADMVSGIWLLNKVKELLK